MTTQPTQVTTALTAAQIAAVEAKAAQEKPAQATPAPAVTIARTEGRTKTVQLEWPIQVDGRTVESVTIRRLTGHDFRALSSLPAGADENAELMAMMTDLPVAAFDAMDGDDYAAISQEARGFLPRALQEAAKQASASGEDSQH